jgi:hypothetical protein
MEESSDQLIPTPNATSKWSIGTYLRIKPLGHDEHEAIQYRIQGKLKMGNDFLLMKFIANRCKNSRWKFTFSR